SSDKVRLAVDLDHRSNATARVDVRVDQPLARLAALLLLHGGEPLPPQNLARLLQVAPGLLQRPSAIHDPGAGRLPELLDLLSRYRQNAPSELCAEAAASHCCTVATARLLALAQLLASRLRHLGRFFPPARRRGR